MADLSVVPYRDGNLDMGGGFDVGAGASSGIDRILSYLTRLVEDGEVDEALVERASFMSDWEDIVSGSRSGWTIEEAGDTRHRDLQP